MGSLTCCFSGLIHPTPSPPLRGEGICAQPFCSLSTFSSGLIFDSEIVELCFEKVLCREACVAQIAIDMTPFFYATVIKEVQVFCDDEWHGNISILSASFLWFFVAKIRFFADNGRFFKIIVL